MYEWVEHTAELELAIAAGSEREVLADALAALNELLDPEPSPAGREHRTLTVTARDRPALLAAWLEELVFLAESEGFVAIALTDLKLSEDGLRLRSRVRGLVGDPPPLVKAVTLHRLLFERRGSGYAARVVLDV